MACIERENMKVNVLGTEYEIIIDDSIVSKGVDGLCKSYDKEIVIRSKGEMLGSEDSESSKEVRYKEVLRHELIHAFFDEAGLDDYSSNEQLVNWIAIQFPKMLKAFIEAGCVDVPYATGGILKPECIIPQEELEEMLKGMKKGGVLKNANT